MMILPKMPSIHHVSRLNFLTSGTLASHDLSIVPCRSPDWVHGLDPVAPLNWLKVRDRHDFPEPAPPVQSRPRDS